MEYKEILKDRKIQIAFSIVASLCFVSCMTVMPETNYYVTDEGIVGLVIGALVGIVVAVALLPTIGSQVTSLENDTGNFSSTERTLIGLWPLFVIVGVMLAIIGFAL